MKKILVTCALLVLMGLGTACGSQGEYGTEADLPEGATALQLHSAGYDFWHRSYYVTVVAGEAEEEEFRALSGELTFRLDGDTFTATFWPPHEPSPPEKARYESAADFVKNYYDATLKEVEEFYPVDCRYQFGGNDKLVFLDEVRSEMFYAEADEDE